MLCVTPACLAFVHAALAARHEAAQAHRTTSASLKAGRTPCRRPLDAHRQHKRASVCVHRLAAGASAHGLRACEAASLLRSLRPAARTRAFGLRASGDRLCLNAAWRREHRYTPSRSVVCPGDEHGLPYPACCPPQASPGRWYGLTAWLLCSLRLLAARRLLLSAVNSQTMP